MRKKININKMNTNPQHTSIEKMKKYFEENPPEIGGQAPKTTQRIEANVQQLMKTNLPTYQRGFELARTKSIVESISYFGPMDAFTIVLVQHGSNLEIHDGRHRVVAYYVLGIKTIPAILVTFNNKEDEINHFNTINDARVGTKLEQKILNGMQANDPLSLLIYELGFTDPESKWCDKVALIGTDKHKEKMSVANFCKVVNWAGLKLRRRREGESIFRALRKIEALTYDEIRSGVNAFHDWFYNFATEIKVVNDVFHKDRVLISLLEFFYCAQKQESKSKMLQPEKIFAASINKFRGYNFTDLSRFDAATAPDALFDHFNKKRGTYPVKRI